MKKYGWSFLLVGPCQPLGPSCFVLRPKSILQGPTTKFLYRGQPRSCYATDQKRPTCISRPRPVVSRCSPKGPLINGVTPLADFRSHHPPSSCGVTKSRIPSHMTSKPSLKPYSQFGNQTYQ